MKKLFVLSIGLFITGLANAQSTDKPITIGAKGGLNISNIIKEDGNNNFKTDYLTGYHAGLTLDIKLFLIVLFIIATNMILANGEKHTIQSKILNQERSYIFLHW